MAVHIHMVETYEEDCHLAVAKHIGGLLDEPTGKTALADTPGSIFLAECTRLAGELAYDELIKKLASQLDVVFAQSSEKDAECCVSVIVLLLSRLEKDAQLTELARRLALEIGKNAEQMGEGKADEWRRVWNLTPSMALELYLQLAELMKVVGDRPSTKERLRLLTAGLGLVQQGDAAELKRAAPAAADAVKMFLASADGYQCDFWELPAVQQLSADAATAPLLKLLSTTLMGDLAGFKAAATPAVLESVGVSADAALDKVRLMALLVLGSRANGSAVPLSDIQAALDVPEEQVQPWIVRAIGSKLIEGRIDQVAGTVTITRCTQRSFSAADWEGLSSRLAAISDALTSANAMLLSRAGGGAGGSSGKSTAQSGRGPLQVVH